MRTVIVRTRLDAPADVVWPAVATPHAFVHVAGWVLRYPPAERVDRPWQEGDELVGGLWLFHVLPISRHRLRVARVDHEHRTAVSEERGGMVRRWDHHLVVTPVDDRSCTYEDRIDIDAGPATPVVVAFAHGFYRIRQRRWRQLARLLRAVDAGRGGSDQATGVGTSGSTAVTAGPPQASTPAPTSEHAAATR